MTLENTMIKSLSEWRPASRESLLVSDTDSGWSAQITADRCELLGCQVWELTVSRATPPANLKINDWASGIAQKTLGLLEPLKVLEVDEQMQQAILRNQTPVERDGKLFYYEVVLKGTTSATLRRYHASAEGPSRREQVNYILTHDNLASIAGAMTAAS